MSSVLPMRPQILAVLGLPFVALTVACVADGPTAPPATRANASSTRVGSDVIATLKGVVVLNDNGEQLALGAIKYSDGSIVGFASGVNPGTLNGPVVELVPPQGANDFWCANVSVANVPELQGFNFLWLIKDTGNGGSSFDQIATNGGFGLSCASGPGGPFSPVVSGDFKAKVR
jgi:hypothetical protein